MITETSLEALVRGAGGPGALLPLVRALGLNGVARSEAAWPELEALPGVARATLVGDAGGLRTVLLELEQAAEGERVTRLARVLQRRDPLHPHLLIAADPGFARLTLAASGLDGAVRRLALRRDRPGRAELEALHDLAARPGETGTALALRHARVLERSGVTRRFFHDFRARRASIAAAWQNLPAAVDQHRDALALLFLSRLMFLYFLQREGHLAGDAEYLARLVRSPGQDGASIYRGRLEPLFFGALNRRPEQRDAAALALGSLPYLNGGLFERHPLEREAGQLDLPDGTVLDAFDQLLDRYRFTARERHAHASGEAEAGGIDPEMLGRVFEELMAPAQRGATGSYYTPHATVARLTREAFVTYATGPGRLTEPEARELMRGHRPASLDHGRARSAALALARARVLDPACGSGAFLLGALSCLGRARLALEPGSGRRLWREIVAQSLHGVDLQADAALLCALRLWLALARDQNDRPPDSPPGAGLRDPVPPLPNLDLRIRQGDALLDPMDLLAPGEARRAPDGAVRAAIARIRGVAGRYLEAEPGEREALKAELRLEEACLAEAWLLAACRRLERRRRELAALALDLDLFGERTVAAVQAEREQAGLTSALAEADRLLADLRRAGALPFFSFAVHFADTAERGFDLVLSNPPWLRALRWPAATRRLVRSRYDVCRPAGWRRGAELAGAPAAAAAQTDLALLFLERAIALLAPDGVLGMVLPAKTLRSLYGAGGRRLLLERARPVAIEDHSLDQHSIFRADAFAATVVARRRPAGDEAPSPGSATDPAVRVTMVRRRVPPLRFALAWHELPLVPGDTDSPWLLAPPGARAALRAMQLHPALAEDPLLRVRRGVFTGANDVLLVREAEPRLGGLALLRAEGLWQRGRPGDDARQPADAYEAVVEARALAPTVRGAGIAAWGYRVQTQVVWLHDEATAASLPAPPLMARYLERHAPRLRARPGTRAGAQPGSLLRLTGDTLRPKVAWQDLATTLEAVALPARVPGIGGTPRPLVPLNTVYFIPMAAAPEAMLLAAYLNSLPVRTFARAIAERAKDARFRFFAWVVALLPLPRGWRSGETARRLLRIARDAHAAGTIEDTAQQELDALVAARYGLDRAQIAELQGFDRWLRGVG